MPRTTPLENLPYPCLSEPFARQPIQNLAEAADSTLFRMKSDIDLIDKRPRGRMRLTASSTFTNTAYSPIPMNNIDYDNRSGANIVAGSGPWFKPHLPGLYYGELQFGVNANSGITKINLVMETGNFSSGSTTIITHVGRSFNQDQAEFAFTMRVTGLIHYDNVAHEIQARVRHQGVLNMLSSSAIFTIQHLSGCLNQLVPNPDFEKNISGWQGLGATIARSTAEAIRGNASLQVTTTGVPNPAVTIPAASRFPVTVGQRYNAAAHVRQNGTGTEQYSVSLIWFDSGGGAISGSTAILTTVGPNSWRRIPLSAVAPANAATAALQVRRDTSTTPVPTFWIDDTTVWSGC